MSRLRLIAFVSALALIAGCTTPTENPAPEGVATQGRTALSEAIDRARARLVAKPGATDTPEATRSTEAFLSSLIEAAGVSPIALGDAEGTYEFEYDTGMLAHAGCA